MLVYFAAILCILRPFGTFLWLFGIYFPVLVFSTKKNLTTLPYSEAGVDLFSLGDIVGIFLVTDSPDPADQNSPSGVVTQVAHLLSRVLSFVPGLLKFCTCVRKFVLV
jgi:hypothetical protein